MGSAPATLSFEYRDASGLAVRKDFGFDPAHPYVVDFTAAVSQNGAPLNPTVQWGPALGTGIIERSGSYNPPAQPIFYRDGSVTRVKTSNIQKSPNEEGELRLRRRGRSLLPDCGAPGQRATPRRVSAGLGPGRGLDDRRQLRVAGRHVRPARRRRRRGISSVRRISTCSPASIAISCARSTSACSRGIVVPLLRALKWVNGYRRQLRLVDHHPDRHHQPRDVPAAAQERRVDAEDAGDPAGGEGDPGSLREAEDDRSGEAEDERRADGLYRERGVNPGERLRADAADAAGAVRVLRDAVGGDRAARRAVRRLDSRSVGARSALHHAGPDGRHACSCSSG